VYSRTATVMHDLEEQLGREVMERAFRGYYAKWHFRHPSIADLRESLIEASGDREHVERVFRQNVYGVEDVDHRIESLTSKADVPEPGTTFEGGKWTERTEEAVEKQTEEQRAAWGKAHPDAKNGEGPFPYRTAPIRRGDCIAHARRLGPVFSTVCVRDPMARPGPGRPKVARAIGRERQSSRISRPGDGMRHAMQHACPGSQHLTFRVDRRRVSCTRW
jgi:hypothetical protein